MPDTPLDLDAIRANLERRVSVQWKNQVIRDLLAEAERLRAESVPCVDCVDRSSLVQVGWECGHHKMPDYGDTCPAHLDRECQPVYVIREDTDAN